MPVYATFFLVITLSSIGLPMLNGFVGEFLVLGGAFQARTLWGALAATGVIWSAAYMLWMYQRVFYGQVTGEHNAALADIGGRERLALWPTVLAALVMGLLPWWWLGTIESGVRRVLPALKELSQVIGR
jgi:NADH-quinone oxidoreductase subunit M